MLTLQIKGYQEAKQVLDQLPAKMQKKLIKTALKTSVKPMVAKAKSYAPRKSGFLQKSIKSAYLRRLKVQPTEVAVGVTTFASRTTSISNGKKVRKKSYPFYVRFIHQGTKTGIKANPFLERAYNEEKDNVTKNFGDNLGKAVENFVKKKFKPI